MREANTGSNPLGCGLAQVAALEPHWGSIHSRDQGTSLYFNCEKKNHPDGVVFLLAGAEGLEFAPAGLVGLRLSGPTGA